MLNCDNSPQKTHWWSQTFGLQCKLFHLSFFFSNSLFLKLTDHERNTISFYVSLHCLSSAKYSSGMNVASAHWLYRRCSYLCQSDSLFMYCVRCEASMHLLSALIACLNVDFLALLMQQDQSLLSRRKVVWWGRVYYAVLRCASADLSECRLCLDTFTHQSSNSWGNQQGTTQTPFLSRALSHSHAVKWTTHL